MGKIFDQSDPPSSPKGAGTCKSSTTYRPSWNPHEPCVNWKGLCFGVFEPKHIPSTCIYKLPQKKSSYLTLYCLFTRDPYSGWFQSPHNWVGFHPLGFFHCSSWSRLGENLSIPALTRGACLDSPSVSLAKTFRTDFVWIGPRYIHSYHSWSMTQRHQLHKLT